ncbi:MAG TPA: hypothetical protein VFG52_01675 [Xanthomonadales bacterium]|nr:hypothetical protein [Xanthomonadales bacterium]
MTSNRINRKDIQAIFRGYDRRWPVGRFFFCRYESSVAGLRLLKWIISEYGNLTSYDDLDNSPDIAINFAFTYPGLAMLGLVPEILESFPGDFRQGMLRRAPQNRDSGINGPENWDEIWNEQGKVHAWIGVYARSPDLLDSFSASLESLISELAEEFASGDWDQHPEDDAGFVAPLGFSFFESVKRDDCHPGTEPGKPPVSIAGQQDVERFWSDKAPDMHIDDPKSKAGGSVLLEHFGFRDGISQPVIKGLEGTSDKAKAAVRGGGKLSPKSGRWEPLATGEFLLGYVDEIGEIPVAPIPPNLAMNGSFMVMRKLYQDVDRFRDYLEEQASGLKDREGKPLSADYLAARMFGRERDGTPLAKIPPGGNETNEFRYSEDLDGSRCPLGAHMRRANPRDSLVMDESVAQKYGSLLVNRHRLLRRAITYGKPVPAGARQADVNPNGQGLMFITLQSSITGQFEFVQQEWINFGNDINQGIDRDPICGTQRENARMVIPGNAHSGSVICQNLPNFVRNQGGDYFFLPGIGAFNLLAGNRYAASLESP